MAKFHGKLGYVTTSETSPGVYTDVVTEKDCQGDILRNNQRWDYVAQVNSNITINNRFSIRADQFALSNIQYIRYLVWNNIKWAVSSVEVERPRLILTVGGVFNG